MKQKLGRDYYFKKDYDSKERFASYWHQISEILATNPKRVLEIGIGGGLVKDCLKKRGVNVTTVDIEERLSPDIVASIEKMPFASNTFDVAAAFETLEHLPYTKFSEALKELKRVSKRFVIISLPDTTRAFPIMLGKSRVFSFRKLIIFPKFRKRKKCLDKHHCWEIGMENSPLQKIVNDISKTGLKIKKSYRPLENHYHRFFILVKESNKNK